LSAGLESWWLASRRNSAKISWLVSQKAWLVSWLKVAFSWLLFAGSGCRW